MKVRWLEEARNDLREIRDYIAKRNPAAARELAVDFRAARDRIKRYPEMQPIGDIPGTRELVVRRYRCTMVYRIKADLVEIVWVFGPGQDRFGRAKDDPR